MTRIIFCIAILCTTACALDEIETSTGEQAGSNLQGSNLQGVGMQGSNLQGMTLQGFFFAGATLGSATLSNVRVERGELVAEPGIGQFVRRARFGEQLAPAGAATAA